MRRKMILGTLIMMFVLALSPTTASANDAISVTTNGQPVVFADQNPLIVNGRTLVPVAGVFQALGFETAWDGSAQQVTITRGSDMIILTIGSASFTANGANHALDVPAQIIGGRTMLPIAAVVRSVGYEVDWDGGTRTVLISAAPTVATALVPTPAALPAPTQQLPVDWAQAPTSQPLVEHTLIGVWAWMNNPYYIFEVGGTGMMGTTPINWSASNGILSICNTPSLCQGDCIAPMEWYYILEANQLTLTSTLIPGLSYAYTRNDPILETPVPTPTPESEQVQNVDLQATVWVPRTRNNIYHRINDCGRMNPNTATPYTREAIRAQGYRACDRCW